MLPGRRGGIVREQLRLREYRRRCQIQGVQLELWLQEVPARRFLQGLGRGWGSGVRGWGSGHWTVILYSLPPAQTD